MRNLSPHLPACSLGHWEEVQWSVQQAPWEATRARRSGFMVERDEQDMFTPECTLTSWHTSHPGPGWLVQFEMAPRREKP